MPANPTLASLAADLEAGRTTARKLVEECLARIADPAGEGERAFIHVDKEGALAGLSGLSDPRLQGKHIGVTAGTPPATAMAQLGLIQHARPYPLMVDRRYDSPGERMIGDIQSGEIDAGVLWGPIAGYFAPKAGLEVVPLLKDETAARMAYRITFGVRPLDDDWKRQLNTLIAKRQGDFDAVLLQFGVPLLDEQNRLITQPRK